MGLKVAFQQELADGLLVPAVYPGVVVHKGALAAPLQHVLRKSRGKCGSGDGPVLASRYPHPGGSAEAGLHHWLREQRHPYPSLTGSKCGIRKHLVTGQVENSLPIAGKGTDRRIEPGV